MSYWLLREDNNGMNGSRGNKQRNDKTDMGEKHHIQLYYNYSVR